MGRHMNSSAHRTELPCDLLWHLPVHGSGGGAAPSGGMLCRSSAGPQGSGASPWHRSVRAKYTQSTRFAPAARSMSVSVHAALRSSTRSSTCNLTNRCAWRMDHGLDRCRRTLRLCSSLSAFSVRSGRTDALRNTRASGFRHWRRHGSPSRRSRQGTAP